MEIQSKYKQLQQKLRDTGSVVVAYSGGVDSTFLLKAAIDTLGSENVLGCIGISASLSERQYKRAIKSAESTGANLEEVQVEELRDNKYSANDADRCFYCKSCLYEVLTDIAEKKGFGKVICGSNFDDMDDYRPGNKAAEVYGVGSPIAEVKITKSEIRRLSRKLGLPTADLPASPCLASRITYGLKVTEKRLKQIEKAEYLLKDMGFTEFRVRHRDDTARIEVNPADFEKIINESNRAEIITEFKTIGFKYITLDLQGFRSGSMNEVLTAGQTSR
jgi:uncharacterized protein